MSKVIFESFGRDGLAGPMDEVEGSGPILSKLLDQWCFVWLVIGHGQAEKLDLRQPGLGDLTQLHLELLYWCQHKTVITVGKAC